MPNQTSSSTSLAASLKPLLKLRKAQLSVGEMLDTVESKDGLGPVLFALTLPVLAPLPPGVSMIFALPLLIVAPQIVMGRREVWLPKWLSDRPIKRPELVKVIHKVLPPLERVEKIVRPRLTLLTDSLGARLIGVACTLIALVLVLPIPFANLVPSLAMCLFALGLTRRDGVLVLGGYGLMALAVAVIWLGVHGFGIGLTRLKALL